MTSRQPKQSSKRGHHPMTRRSFIGTTAAGSAALLTGGLASLFKESASAGGDFPFVEASIMQLQAAMAAGQLSARTGPRLSESHSATESNTACGD